MYEKIRIFRFFLRIPRQKWLFWALCSLIAAANAFALSRNPLNPDISWYLWVGNQLMHGKKMYLDIVETNPPLICFLHVAPVFLANLFGLAAKNVWITMVTLALAGCALISGRLLGRACRWREPEARVAGLFLFVLLLVPFPIQFGQRENLAFAALLPLVLAAACRVHSIRVSRSLIVGLSIAAGMLLALKPYFLVPWALCLLLEVRIRGWRRVVSLPENYIVPAFTLMNLLMIGIATPEYFALVPGLLKDYRGSNVPRMDILASPEIAIPLLGAVASLFYKASKLTRVALRFLSIMTAGWAISALMQHKGFPYHLQPVLTSFLIIAFIVLIDLMCRRRVWSQIAGISRPVAVQMVMVSIALYGISAYRGRWDTYFGTDRLLPILESQARNSPVVFLSTSGIGFPLTTEAGLAFAGSHYHLWSLPGVYQREIWNARPGQRIAYHAPNRMDQWERDLIDRTCFDLAKRPAFIVVASGAKLPDFGEAVFELEPYFQQDSRIRKLWAEYDQISSDQLFHVYQLKPQRRS